MSTLLPFIQKRHLLWMMLVFAAPACLMAQCVAPTYSSVMVTGTTTATLCWTSGQGDVSNHKWNVKVNDLTNGVLAVLDLEAAPGSPGLSITPGVGGPAPIQICLALTLPKAGTQYQPVVAEQCDGAIASLSAATTMPAFTTNAAAPETPAMPTQFKTVSQTVTHTASFQDIQLDPTPLVGAPSRLSFTRDLLADVEDFGSPNTGNQILFSIIENLLGVDIPDWVQTAGSSLGIPGVVEFSLTPTLQFGVTGDYGGYIGLNSVGTADVDVTYPVNVTLQVPGDQQFGCGDKILVQTTAQRGSGAQLAITPAFYETEMGPIFDNVSFVIRIGLTARIEIGCDPIFDSGCAYSNSWNLLDELGIPNGELLNIPIDVPSLPPFIRVCENAFDPSANLGTLVDCSAGTNLLGQILDLINATAPVAGPIIDNMFDATNTTVEINNPDIPSAANIPIPEFDGTFRKIQASDLQMSTMGNKLIVNVPGGEFEELSKLRLDLISLLDFFEIPTSLSLGAGLGEVDFGDLNLNLTTDLELNYTFDPTFRANINLGQPMNWRVINPGTNTTVATGSTAIIPNVLMGNNIEINIPDNFESTATINEEYLMSANFTTLSKLHYNNSLSIELFQISGPGISFSLLPEFEIVETEMPGSPKTIEDHTLSWEQNSFNKPTQSFNLVPDQMDPVVSCKPVTVTLNQWGSASIQPADVYNQATSFDLPATGTGQLRPVSLSVNSFNCGDINGRQTTLTVEDRNCNQSTCTATVTVIDNSPPQMDCPGSFVVQNDLGFCGATVTVPVPGVFDNCSYTLLARYQEVDASNAPIGPLSGWVTNPDGFYAVGRWKIEWQAKDPSNNQQTCIFYFDVIDTEKPVMHCFNPTYVFNGQPSLDLILSDFVTATDNCQMAGLSINMDKIYCQQLGSVLTVTATAVDIYNNTQQCTSTLTIGGLPCGWSQNPDGVGCDDGNHFTYNVPAQVFTANSTDCYYASPFNSDELAFARRSLCGNGSITAQVTSLTGNALGWAGVIMWEDYAPGARKVQLTTNMNSNLSRREVRTVTNGQAYPQQFPAQNRFWLRLVRQGGQFSGYTSINGVQWYLAMTANVSMNNCIDMGLVLTNYDPSSTVSATFANVNYIGTGINLVAPNDYGNWIESSNQLDFAVFPNPTSGMTNIQFGQETTDDVKIMVLNSLGEPVMAPFQMPKGEMDALLDLGHLPTGVYLIQVAAPGSSPLAKRIVLTK